MLAALDHILGQHRLDKDRLIRVRIYCAPSGSTGSSGSDVPSPEAIQAVVGAWNSYFHPGSGSGSAAGSELPLHIPVVDLLPQRLLPEGALVGVEATAACYENEGNDQLKAY